MAFNLFPKPPAKVKPAEGKARPELSPRHDARAPASQAPTSAREIAAAVKNRSLAPVAPPSVTPATDARERDITLTGPHSMMGWTIGLQQSILVAEANPDLCTVLAGRRRPRVKFSSMASPMMIRQRLQHSLGSPCSICFSAKATTSHSTGSPCSTWSRSSARLLRGKRAGRGRVPVRGRSLAVTSGLPAN